MNKFYSIFGGAVVVVFFALTIPSDAYGYIERGNEYEMPGACATPIINAITSVYPGVDVPSVQSWYCRRTADDEESPNGAFCYGEYTLTMPSDDWIAKAQVDGIGHWKPSETIGDNVVLKRRTKGVGLNASQLAAHSPFVINCLKDNGGASVQWARVLDFRVFRNDGVKIQTNYAATDTALEIAKKDIAGEVIGLIVPESE